MLEKDLYQKLKKIWLPYYITRIEPKYSGGIPDVLVVNKHLEKIFIELKCLPFDDKKIKIPIRPSQLLWFLKYPSFAYVLSCIYKKDNTKIYCLFSKERIQQFQQGVLWLEFETFHDVILTYDLQDIVNFFHTIKY
jgi:hypothetical protein